MSNVFSSVELSTEAAQQIVRTNCNADMLLSTLNQLPDSREKSLAITKLEECVMWANKCASRNL